jgi:hypothetical protein
MWPKEKAVVMEVIGRRKRITIMIYAVLPEAALLHDISAQCK